MHHSRRGIPRRPTSSSAVDDLVCKARMNDLNHDVLSDKTLSDKALPDKVLPDIEAVA
jgi:hypothetical protein